MKKCSFCAQEIQSDANVCMFCNRAQPARFRPPLQKRSYSNMGRLVALVAGGTVAMMVWATSSKRQPAIFEQRSQKTLEVSGARHARGIDIINREAEPLTECVISLSDRGRSNEWTAVIQKLAPMQRETVTWAQFRRADGSEMPAYIGETTRYATVKCESHKDTRKGAALPFR